MGTDNAEFIAAHVELFNQAVTSGDFSAMLATFTDDAVARFENVPGAGSLEFRGLEGVRAAYATQPPDDHIDLVGDAKVVDDTVEARFSWRRDGGTGTLRLLRQGDRIAGMTVVFD